MIDKNTRLTELFKNNAHAVEVFKRFGLACPSCKGQAQDTIDKVAVNNGLDPQALLDALNGK
jgi:hybrid cluster-associated redox disulfide protein